MRENGSTGSFHEIMRHIQCTTYRAINSGGKESKVSVNESGGEMKVGENHDDDEEGNLRHRIM